MYKRQTFDIVGWVLPNAEMVHTQMATIDVSKDALLRDVIAATEPFVVEDLRLDPRADQKQVEFFGNRTSIVVPMFEGDARIGPMVVPTYADQGVMPPTREELEFLIQVGSLVAVVIGRLRAEDARRALEDAAATNQRALALGRMAGEVAHDFNNLLLIIRGNTELAMDELAGHSAHPLLAEVDRAAQRASALTRQLLAFSRGQVLDLQPVQVGGLLRAIPQLMGRLLPPGVELRVDVDAAVGVLQADSSQLERVFMNLILNARDAVKGKGHITLEAEMADLDGEYVATRTVLTPGRYLVVSVSDDGQGMDRVTQQRIFEPFFNTKPADRGTGLGLSVVDGVVRQHGGYVHVYSEPGLGSTFKVYLPAGPPGLNIAPVSHVTPPELRGTQTLLVVDDDASVLRTVERILQRAAYTVLTAGNAADALALLQSHAVDMLLTDVVLVGTDGVELALQARAHQPDLGVLFMTGYARGKLSAHSLPHLGKPFSATDLLRRVKETLTARQARRAGLAS